MSKDGGIAEIHSSSSNESSKVLDEKLEKMSVEENEACLSSADFDFLKVLGTGGYGTVYQVRKLNGSDKGKVFALKKLNRPKKEKDVEHIKNEKKVLETTKSPFLCEMHYSFETESKMYFVLEYLHGGELFSLLVRQERLTEDEARFYLAEIVLALEHLHNSHIIYRDLKPDNVMVDRNGHLKLTDFGLCKFNLPIGQNTRTVCGTPEYMAPEVIVREPYGHPVDLWALGIVMFDMFAGGPPFQGDTTKELTHHILNGKIKMLTGVTKEVQSLVRGLIKRNPQARLTLPQVKEHPFFVSIDWEIYKAHGSEPPFKPEIRNDTDVSYFDSSFTSMTPEESPSKSKQPEKENDPFEGFDCVIDEKETKKDFEPVGKINAIRNLAVAISTPETSCTKDTPCTTSDG